MWPQAMSSRSDLVPFSADASPAHGGAAAHGCDHGAPVHGSAEGRPHGVCRGAVDTKDGYFFKAKGQTFGPFTSEKFEW